MNRVIAMVVLCLLLVACTVNKEFTVAKGQPSSKYQEQTLVYALPQTVLTVTVEVVKNTFKRGPYAEYAQKYLGISYAPTADSVWWELTDAKIGTQQEADPSQYYTLTYSSYPENLQTLFSISGAGVILDFANSWKSSIGKVASANSPEGCSDINLTGRGEKEKIDTFYKTIITDTSIVKVPFIKKKILVKTTEYYAQETARQNLKTRNTKIRILRGEEDFHPDASTLKIMVSELEKEEGRYLSMFIGLKHKETFSHTFTIIPTPEFQTKELGYFGAVGGFKDLKAGQDFPVNITLSKESETKPTSVPATAKNALLMRIPTMTSVSISCGERTVVSKRLPIYQFGMAQVLPLK